MEFLKAVKPPINVKAVAASVVVLFAVLSMLSMGNTSNYYIKIKHGSTYVYQGAFAPVGKNLIATVPGAMEPAQTKDVYTEADILPILFRSYVDQALALKNNPGSPDFGAITCLLQKAESYATTPEEMMIVKKHLTAVNAIKEAYNSTVNP